MNEKYVTWLTKIPYKKQNVYRLEEKQYYNESYLHKFYACFARRKAQGFFIYKKIVQVCLVLIYRLFSIIRRSYFKLTRFLGALIFKSFLFSSHAYF